MRIFFLFLFLFSNYILYSQTSEISGIITDSSNGEILPQVNIQVNGIQYGTITNRNGYFKLKIPQKYLNKQLVFSSIGYENKVATIRKDRKWYSLSLKPYDTQIDEIIIMPDSTLLTFLEKAFKKIPDNYPTKPTILKGFYREAMRTDKNQYIYFAEAITENYKTGYQKADNMGQVKIIKSMANEFSGSDTLNQIKFYGGAFLPSRADFVYKKIDFINPKKFKNYQYSLIGTTIFNNRSVYIIYFDNNNEILNGHYKGKFYIDKLSLAYIAFDVELTQKGLDNHNSINIVGYKRTSIKTKVSYELNKGVWNLKYIEGIAKAKNKIYDGFFIEDNEFITTEIQTENIKIIPLNEQIEFGDIFLDKASEYYSDNYWEEYNILEQDTFLRNFIKPLYTKEESKDLLTMKITPPKEPLFLKVANKMNFVYNLSYFPISSVNNNFQGTYISNDTEINLKSEKSAFDYKLGLQFSYSYSINKRWELSYNMSGSLNEKEFYSKVQDFGLNYNFSLNRKGRPIIMKFSLLYSSNQFTSNFSAHSGQTFSIKNKEFDASDLIVGVGEKVNGIKPELHIYKKLRGLFWWHLSASYLYSLSSKSIFYVKENSGFSLTRKHSIIDLDNDNLQLRINDASTNKSNLVVGNYFFNFGIAMRL